MSSTATQYLLRVCRSVDALRRVVLLLVLAALVPALSAGAAVARRSYDIPAGDADHTLRQFVEQSGEQLIYVVPRVRGVKTNPVKGKFTAREVLQLMVARTTLVVVEDAKTGALTINRAESKGPPATGESPQSSPSNSAKPPGSTSRMKSNRLLALFAGWLALGAGPADAPAASSERPNAATEEPVVLSIFQVTSDKDVGYRSTQTVSGSRTIAELRDTPSSISVLNRELLDDIIATRVSDALYFAVAGEIDTNTETHNENFVFRGVTATFRLRNGVTWSGGTSDAYNIERVELLRGPHAFLYGEGSAGGVANQLTKQATYRNFERANLITGSHDLYRAELDINRRLNDRFALRTALVASTEKSFQHHVSNKVQGVYVAANYRPFRRTNINTSFEYRNIEGVMGSSMLADGYSTTDRTGATTTLSATTGGRTYIPALGISYDSTGRRRSTGTTILVTDPAILPREYNFPGPGALRTSLERSFSFEIDQKLAETFNVQASYSAFDVTKHYYQRVGNSSTAIYRDTNATLPSGAPNPYFNELYTEYFFRRNDHQQPINCARLTAVYELKHRFTTQKIVASGVYFDATPEDIKYSEFVDPASGNFKGSFNPANTAAANSANVAVQNQNFFLRRFYLRDGDDARLTAPGPIAGQSLLQRDQAAEGTTGRLSNRLYRVPAYGAGVDGSYWGGRVHSLVGWRHSQFMQDPSRDFFNPGTGQLYKLDTPLSYVRTRLQENCFNYGAVVHFNRNLGAYYNYAESAALSSGVGGAQLTPGKVRGPTVGDGQEIGLRWAFLEGRIESNWTYFITNAKRTAINPAIPTTVRVDELGRIFGSAIDVNGTDLQTTRSTGLEIETVTNLTKNWRLTWNIAKNDLKTSERYLQLKAYQAEARAKNIPTPETDTFLATVPDGTPLPGFTKHRSNLLTMYRFTEGWLRTLSVGGSVQYRDKSYRGDFDLNRDGIAERLWSPGYSLYNVMLGYRLKIMRRDVSLSLNINNVLNKEYYRSFALASGAWGEGRSFRFAARLDL
jgi:outer membrane receptor protein involved in Fe transport